VNILCAYNVVDGATNKSGMTQNEAFAYVRANLFFRGFGGEANAPRYLTIAHQPYPDSNTM